MEEAPPLSRAMLSQSRVIAKGNRIRDEADGLLYEYHWYEHHGIGRVEVRQKEMGTP